ncbi:MAG: efflux RND transporter permease subunit [Gemmatimonadaceae bacterium]|nr:efflux RND transporter permease subunit [Gloeobacterales cyanobacterium ES-bin-141]
MKSDLPGREAAPEHNRPGPLQSYVRWALSQRLLFWVMLFAVVGVGSWSLSRFPIDGLPDISNVQVQVITDAPSLGLQEVEQQITFPLETALTGLPRSTQLRSVTKYGLSQITVVFEDGVDLYFARQLVNERLRNAGQLLPMGVKQPVLGPVATGLGEIFYFELEGDGRKSPTELRTLMDWTVIPKLRTVPGIAEINPIGGYVKQYQVRLYSERLVGYGITPRRIFAALSANNANSGGGYTVNPGGEQTVIRAAGFVRGVEDIGDIVIATHGGAPVRVRDVAEVEIGHRLPQGAGSRDGRDGAVLASVLMRAGGNANTVTSRLKEAMANLQKQLPEGVRIVPHYDRTLLVNAAIRTVVTNLVEGAVLVTAILLLTLGSVRGALITAAIIPLSMLIAVTGMLIGRVSGNLMSLGAIDFGLLVDGGVVMIENIIFRLAHEQPSTTKERLAAIASASAEFARPVVFGIGIIAMVYLPIFGLSGVEGKLFQPMAFTVILALVASLVLTLSLVPLASYFAFSRRLPKERETLLIAAVRPPYERTVGWLMGKHIPVTALCTAIFVASVALVLPRLGSEFVPNLSEGNVVINMRRPPSASIQEAARQGLILERTILEFPEVQSVYSTSGHPELATDTYGPENTDVNIILKPQEEWKSTKSQPELVAKLESRVAGLVPGVELSYSQIVQQRINELLSGDRQDIALRIYGPDIGVLERFAQRAAGVIAAVPGAADVRSEAVRGLPVLTFAVDRALLAQYGVDAREVLDTIEATRVGKTAGTIYEGRLRFDLTVKFADAGGSLGEAIRALPVSARDGGLVPLGALTTLGTEDGLAQVSHREGERVITVGMNVRGRDLGSFVAAAQEAIEKQTEVPQGYRLVWGGQFENYQSASERLRVLVPLSLVLIFLLLYGTFGSLRPGVLIFLNVPFSLVGGLVALWLRGYPLSVSAGVGFIALFGIAVLNGIVLVSKIRDLEAAEGLQPAVAALKGASERLRPILTTTLVASIGFIPMAIAVSAGAEVQRPLATVVIGGLVTCTSFNLFALPVLYPVLCGLGGLGRRTPLWERLRKRMGWGQLRVR